MIDFQCIEPMIVINCSFVELINLKNTKKHIKNESINF